MLGRETSRLRALFERVIVLSAAAGGAAGLHHCSTPARGNGGDASAGQDATDQRDATTGDAPLDAPSDAVGESPWPPGCAPPPPFAYDAGADSPGCEYRVDLPCGLPPFVTTLFPPNCVMPEVDCTQICTGPADPALQCEVANGFGCDVDAQAFVAPDGAPIVVECDKCTGAGRRPAGLVRVRPRRAVGDLGAFFAGVAHLEAASVHAFATLADELRAHGAPAELVRAARRSARDEVRHARVMGRIARRHGSEPPPVRVARPRRRSFAAIAIDNAVEGCVRETFGALLATWQATHAEDERIARAMSRIAADETRHAALAWAIARWMEPRLDKRSRRRLAAARRRAVDTLRRSASAPLRPALVRVAGLPSPCRASRMLEELFGVICAHPGTTRTRKSVTLGPWQTTDSSASSSSAASL
jgi:hypothetical protein